MLGKEIPRVGLTTFRAPYTPVTYGTLIGHSRGKLFDPTRKTPLHDWEEAHGAVFEDVGNWKRAWFYPRSGENIYRLRNIVRAEPDPSLFTPPADYTVQDRGVRRPQ